ncbi:hypothetical protein DFQ28_011425 [Apophysomyces sp. BC1034]|nr:hypothetical protein DFQ28_011425 [Apophysomyces sp. BC1034]
MIGGMDVLLDPRTGGYTGTQTATLANSVYIRLATPVGAWWAAPEVGSLLHTLAREKDRPRVQRLAVQYAEQALAPLIDDGRAIRIAVTSQSYEKGWLMLLIEVHEAAGNMRHFQHPVKIRKNILREIMNLQSDADTEKGSDHYVRASAAASAIEGLYAHQAWIARQIFPDTADEDYLILHARVRGIERKPAVAASGTARVTGKPGTAISSGLNAKYRDGTPYVTTTGGTLNASGQLVVGIAALTAGVMGNRQDGDTLTLTVPPIDVDPSLTIISVRGGT